MLKQELIETLDYESATDYCRMYCDIGYRTNGQLRHFFKNEEINQLYALAVSNSENNKAVESLVLMGKHSFWSMFGTKITRSLLIIYF